MELAESLFLLCETRTTPPMIQKSRTGQRNQKQQHNPAAAAPDPPARARPPFVSPLGERAAELATHTATSPVTRAIGNRSRESTPCCAVLAHDILFSLLPSLPPESTHGPSSLAFSGRPRSYLPFRYRYSPRPPSPPERRRRHPVVGAWWGRITYSLA